MACSVITVSGTPGSGKTELAKNLSAWLKEREYTEYQYFSPGEFRKGLISSRGTGVRGYEEMSAEQQNRMVDEHAIYLMKTGRVVVDGIYSAVLCYLNNIDAFHVYLDAPPEMRSRRISERNRRERKGKSCAVEELFDQENVEVKVGRRMYSIDYRFPALYDAILDTGKLSSEKVLKMLLSSMRIRCGRPARAAAEIY
jgi:cytidylate kinase